MKRIQKAIKMVRNVDRYSPYPLFCPCAGMSRNEKVLFDRCISKASYYLEFGLGGTTIRAIQKSRAIIHTVESSRAWVDYMRKYLVLRHFENRRVFLFPVDIGPVRQWGLPESDKHKNLFPSYSSDVFALIDSKRVDLVLIDGRFRVACVLKVILECNRNENLRILIHDFWNRDHYHIVLKYLDVVEKMETMGLFSIKEDVSLALVAEDYEAYKGDPS